MSTTRLPANPMNKRLQKDQWLFDRYATNVNNLDKG